ncbi:TonB-dependent receptor [Phytopseudomonas daroniae]|uniref:TonB-dependent receptor n=1 Tax=Pseudomonadaceae TaxID=135621 RepID=UPI001A9560C4|nr:MULTISPECIES: TonB-dependent receptor [Pseudomonas]
MNSSEKSTETTRQHRAGMAIPSAAHRRIATNSYSRNPSKAGCPRCASIRGSMQGWRRSTVNITAGPQREYRDSNNKQVEPNEGKNYEVGIKGEFFHGRLNASIVYF